jgi:putative oxidoreductase
MTWLFRPGSPRQIDAGIALVRVLTGVVFAAHGAQKVFTMGLPAVTGFFTQAGIPLPSLSALLVSYVELCGGILLIFGLLTRVAAFLLACNMVGAIMFVHVTKGFFLPEGYEFALTLLVSTIALELTGPGAYSIDARFWPRALVPASATPAPVPTAVPPAARPAPPPAAPRPRWASRRERSPRDRAKPGS